MPIEVVNVSYVYMPGTPFEVKALDGASFKIEAGEFVGVIGHTGSGKSTLVQHLNGLIKPTLGCVYVNGMSLNDKNTSLRDVRRAVGLVFQYPEYQLFEETVERDIAFGPKNLGLSEDEVASRVAEAARLVGLPDELLKKSPFELSGGEKRRAAIAGVIAMRPDTLVLDEPAAGLDPRGRAEIISLIRAFHRERGASIVMVSHSMDDVALTCHRIIVMDHGKIAFDAAPAEVFKHAEELKKMGLGLPALDELAGRLRARGMSVPAGLVYTPDTLAEAIARNIRGGAADV